MIRFWITLAPPRMPCRGTQWPGRRLRWDDHLRAFHAFERASSPVICSLSGRMSIVESGLQLDEATGPHRSGGGDQGQAGGSHGAGETILHEVVGGGANGSSGAGLESAREEAVSHPGAPDERGQSFGAPGQQGGGHGSNHVSDGNGSAGLRPRRGQQQEEEEHNHVRNRGVGRGGSIGVGNIGSGSPSGVAGARKRSPPAAYRFRCLGCHVDLRVDLPEATTSFRCCECRAVHRVVDPDKAIGGGADKAQRREGHTSVGEAAVHSRVAAASSAFSSAVTSLQAAGKRERAPPRERETREDGEEEGMVKRKNMVLSGYQQFMKDNVALVRLGPSSTLQIIK